MKKNLLTLIAVIMHSVLLNGSAAQGADAQRRAKIAAHRKSVEKNLHGSVAKVIAKQKQLTFLSSAELAQIMVELTASEISALNKSLKESGDDKDLSSPCQLSRIIGFAPFAVMRDTFGKNQPNMGLAKNKGKYNFKASQRFALKTAVLAPHNGNNQYGVVIDEVVKSDGPVSTPTYEYRVQFGHYTDSTSDSDLLKLAGNPIAPEFIGYKKTTATTSPHQNATSLSPQAAVSMESAASIAAAIEKAKTPKSANANSLTPPAASASAAAESPTAKAPAMKPAPKKFVPKLKPSRLGFNFSNMTGKGTIGKSPADKLSTVAESAAGVAGAATTQS